MLTGENDGRVNAAHSRKMVARLQSATSSRRPVLLRTSSSGHGIGTALSERIQQLADVYAFLCEQLGIEYSVIDRGPWSGAVTPVSAQVKAKLVREGLDARLLVSTDPTLSTPIYVGSARSETNRGNIVRFAVGSLQADTRYYYGLEIDGRLDRKKFGEFRTFPAPGPASFTIAFASCARTGSTSDVFDRIREHHPLFYMNMSISTTSTSRPMTVPGSAPHMTPCWPRRSKRSCIGTFRSSISGTITISAATIAIARPLLTRQRA
jgi:hypothetical protein